MQPPSAEPAPALPPSTGDAAPVARTLTVEFTGSGSEYFRIWAVNLLLMVVTLGIYYPFAKLRRLRYFHGNTLVGGQPLAFHGNPWAMLRGYALVLALFAAYGAAGQVSPWAGLLALALIAAVWPALQRAAMQFRLANTSWRGIRLRFVGDMQGAYNAFAPGLLLLGAVLAGGLFTADDGASLGPIWFNIVLGLALLIGSVLAPYGLWLIKRYQHGHFQFASQHSRFTPTAGSFYRLSFQASAVAMACLFVLGIVFAMVGGASLGGARPDFSAFVWLALVMLPVLAAVAVVAHTYYVARMQDLVWNGTRSTALAFRSRLKFRSLLGLNLLNWLLILITLGLYWPFAAVAAARLRLQAVSLVVSSEFERICADPGGAVNDAAGDAAGDIFGIDFGL